MSNSEEVTLAGGAELVMPSDAVTVDPQMTPTSVPSAEQSEKSFAEKVKSCMDSKDKHPKSSEKVDVERAEGDEVGGEGPIYVSHNPCPTDASVKTLLTTPPGGV